MKIASIVLTLWSDLWFLKSVKEDILAKIHLRLAALIQNVALVVENECVKFDEKSVNSMESMVMSVLFEVLTVR